MAKDTFERKKVSVLIVDDSRTMRSMIRAMLSPCPEIEVVGEAGDPYMAREMIRALDPDVLTLDVEMPRMDGLSFLERIMKLRPMPVVMVSSRTSEGSDAAVRALSLGAVGCVDIARLRAGCGSAADLVETVLLAAETTPRALGNRALADHAPDATYDWNGKVTLIGSSTGGVDALLTILSRFPADGPPVVIAQHMPAHFLASFTARLDRHVRPRVLPVEPGARLEKGVIFVAPGGSDHAALSRRDPLRLDVIPDRGADYVPSIDMLFSSAVAHGAAAVGVILTGMGRDGAEAMLRMRQAGAHTIAQSGDTTVVDGMPKAARCLGAAVEIAPLSEIGERILASASRNLKVSS